MYVYKVYYKYVYTYIPPTIFALNFNNNCISYRAYSFRKYVENGYEVVGCERNNNNCGFIGNLYNFHSKFEHLWFFISTNLYGRKFLEKF